MSPRAWDIKSLYLKSFFFGGIVSLIICLACCQTRGTTPSYDTITVTFEPQRWIVERIAGEDFKVNVLLPPGSDPETYSPTISSMRELQRGGIWLHLNTMGFEQSLISGAPAEGIRLVDVSEGIPLLGHEHCGTHNHGGSEGNDHDHGFAEGSADPHLWSSVRNTITIAENTLKQLKMLRPHDASRYQSNFDTLAIELRKLDLSISEALKSSGAKAFMVKHPSLGYFARDYGLNQIATEAEGKEPSPIELAKRFDAAKSQDAHVMVTEPGFASRQTAEFARNAGLRPMEVNLNSYGWLSEIQKLKSL